MTNGMLPNSMGEGRLQGTQCGSRILSLQRQLRLNRRQPKRLHLGIQRETLLQVLRQRFGSRRIARHGKRKSGFDSPRPDSREQASRPRCCPPRLRALP